ncbi:MAG: hypothetical protein KJ950_11300, partial [Proteobacteria bacterium]|nr:hypothetical protein [Pseudomonadota bacterium]MBU1688314.1 hypothetical protein [Pseudomonadota bacterium]
MEPTQTDTPADFTDLPIVEVKAAEDAVASILVAVKNFGLFPAGHASTLKMLNGVQLSLNNFIKHYGDLRIEIEKNRILFEDEVIHEGVSNEDNPSFIFFRDGIRWLEFQEGLTEDEVVTFFKLISHYKHQEEDPDGDLVTALWSAQLSHIAYEATDALWEAEPVLEFSLLNPAAQDYLDQGGGAAVEGFDLLKSVLGIDQPEREKGSRPAGDFQSGLGSTGESESFSPIDNKGIGSHLEGYGGPGEGGGEGDDSGTGLGQGSGLGEAGASDGGFSVKGASIPDSFQVEAEELDFWAMLSQGDKGKAPGKTGDREVGQPGLPGGADGEKDGEEPGRGTGMSTALGAGPGSGQGAGPGSGQGAGPGSGQGAGPGSGQGAGPGSGQGAGPGSGQG